MNFLWPKKFNLPKSMMIHICAAITESTLTSFITIWYSAEAARDTSRLQHLILRVEKVSACNLLSYSNYDSDSKRTGQFFFFILVHASCVAYNFVNSMFFPPWGCYTQPVLNNIIFFWYIAFLSGGALGARRIKRLWAERKIDSC